jgi:hypothetical protein
LLSPGNDVPKRRVCKWILRRIFNEGNFVERAAQGEFTVIVDEHSPNPRYNQPPGTVAHSIRYLGMVDGRAMLIAEAHQYVRPRQYTQTPPDPKWLYTGSEILVMDIDPNHHCEHCRQEAWERFQPMNPPSSPA